MSNPINTVPTGLQSLLDNKSLGKNPDALLEDIRPTIDLTDFFIGNKVLSITTETFVGLAAKATEARIQVPPGELWLVFGVSSRMTKSDAGSANAGFVPVVTNIPGDSNFFYELITNTFPSTFNNATNELSSSVGVLSEPLVLRAPVQLATRVNYYEGGTYNVSTTALYTRLVV